MPFSVYLHIPFCRRLCPYCHFYRVPEVPDWKVYLKAVRAELKQLDGTGLGPVRTIYAGGGTPTLLPGGFYEALFRDLSERFDLNGLAEATIETDGALSRDDLEPYAAAGFDRVSVGIKSFHPPTRETLRAGEQVAESHPVSAARAAGFSSVGLDLVYGIEGQGLEDHLSDLETAVGLEPDHLSLYALEEPEGGGPRQGDQDTAAAMFRHSSRLLRAAGYGRYEITNFARPGHESLHNMTYWEDGDYIGLGPSAHSSLSRGGVRVRRRNRPDIGAYLVDPAGCGEELSRQEGEERAREALILGLRLSRGVMRSSFARRYGVDPLELLGPHVRELVDQRLVRISRARVRLTTRGMLLGNEVFVRIV